GTTTQAPPREHRPQHHARQRRQHGPPHDESVVHDATPREAPRAAPTRTRTGMPSSRRRPTAIPSTPSPTTMHDTMDSNRTSHTRSRNATSPSRVPTNSTFKRSGHGAISLLLHARITARCPCETARSLNTYPLLSRRFGHLSSM